jgi:hypothetical protein
MTNVEWQIFFLGSTLIVPIIILVWEVVHLINFWATIVQIMFAQSTSFLRIIQMTHVAIFLIYYILKAWDLYILYKDNFRFKLNESKSSLIHKHWLYMKMLTSYDLLQMVHKWWPWNNLRHINGQPLQWWFFPNMGW